MSEHQPRDPQHTPEQPAAVAARGVSQTRRNLLRAGAIGAPALVTLKPASVVACSCKLPSGFSVSGNLSRGPKNCADPSETASIWRPRVTKTQVGKDSSGNPVYEYRYTTKGNVVLTIHKATALTSTLGIKTGSYGGATVSDWMGAADNADTGLFMACYVTAWAHANGSNFPFKETLRDMWNAAVIDGTGYTVANQSKKWNKDQVIGYLKFLTGQTPA